MMVRDGKTSARNIGCYVALMAMSSVLMTGFSTVGQDLWFSVVLGSGFAIPLVIMYARIARQHPEKGLFEIIDTLFGKWVANGIILLLCWYALHISALVTRNFSQFVHLISLGETPRAFIIMIMVAVASYLAQSTYKVMGRWALIVVGTIGITLLITVPLALDIMSITNIMPILKSDFRELLSVAFTGCMIAFAETMLVMVGFGDLKKGESPYKVYCIGLALGGLLILTAVLRNVLILGKEMVSASVFPGYVAARVAKPGSFIERIESITAFNHVLLGISKCAICIKVVSVGIGRLLNIQEHTKRIVVPVGMLSAALCVSTFSNMQELIVFASAYRYYALLFTLIIPAVILIKSEMRKRKVRRVHI